ncbi:MAG: N-acetyltransferase [Bacteroidetes bacterium]|nr:MAG: N-acetyltransferase [Bacteroidota bacterium]
MKIIDLNEQYAGTYCHCLEDWNDEMKEAGTHKECWYRAMKDKGLGVKLALNEKEEAVGMIQYIPVEYSYAEGKDLHAILCTWVHGYKKGVGNYQKKGIGKSLLLAAEEDARTKGAKGMVAWGLSIPVWMKASWYRKQGYREVDRNGFLGPALVWKPFTGDASPPKWIRKRKRPERSKAPLVVTGFINGWCPAGNIAFERARRAAAGFGERVSFREVRTSDRAVFLEWGISDAVFIGDRQVGMGPPPGIEKIRKTIRKQLGN